MDSKMNRILICEDRDTTSILRICLNAEGYQTFVAESEEAMVNSMREQEVLLVILGLRFPERNGLEVLASLREWSNVPVLLLVPESDVSSIIAGLNIGADDVVTKPYNAVELVARVKAQLRRYTQLGGRSRQPGILRVGDIVLDDASKVVTVNNRVVSLTPLEYEILSLLMRHPGRVFSPKEMYRAVWNEAPMGAENAVAVHIRHIREKVEANPAEPRYIKVVWGKGYKIQPVSF